MSKLKRIVIYACAALIVNAVGCKNVATKVNDLAEKHDAALTAADTKLSDADAKLASIPNPPAQVKDARTDIGGAKVDIKTAKDIGVQVKDLAQGEAAKNDKLEHEFFSPVQKRIAFGVGATIALVGLAIVLVRFGGFYGFLAGIPILGAVVAKIGFLKPSVKE